MELNVTDIELVRLLRNGDHDALERIYKRYHHVLYSHAYRRLPDREEVRDILHEIFINLWQNRDTFFITSSLSAYLYAAVRSRVLNVVRNQKVRDSYAQSLQAFMDEGVEVTETKFREKELIRLVEQEVRALPTQMRIIFEMSRFQERSHKEVAEELNISPQTVRTQVRNALRILRVKLGDNIFTLFF
ncbi:RNA polymerase sigma-70 factor, ECF subfamily [Sphingobacterium psychroaquaticum]|uniref:RNA polymerase sigma-70 factor, ECF subfamily n=1 Tax=Sphingobacterium psychroaquaticum TaxID=561061 RepID=A0A1X7KTF3_9SPHI|nr:RNA polymerase sigma-70 factor, ECF subfamily [Sphingobacterium psychroaquaticum]